ncbi:zinc metalloprotease [Spirosoma litoris]
MSAPQPSFHPPYDIHLLWGQAIDLLVLLELDQTDVDDYLDGLDASRRVSYQFIPSFLPTADLKITFKNDGTVDRPSCLIELANTPPGDWFNLINNFLVSVVVTDSTNPAKVSVTQTAIRIHIHKSIQDVWITPSPLTVYQDMDSARFCVYALFDDGVVAEIGNLFEGDNGDEIDYSITNPIQLKWSSSTAGLIDSDGEITPVQDTQDHDVTLKVTYGTQTFTRTGTVRMSDVLNANQTAIRVREVANSESPGFAKLNQVPNILFLPEGFTDVGDFNRLVDNYVADLIGNKITAPFNWLKGSINFWSAFVPSRENGITHRGMLEVIENPRETGDNGPTMRGVKPTKAVKPDDEDASTWEFENLLYYVGFPVKGDETLSDFQLKFRWEQTTLLSSIQLSVLFPDPDGDTDQPNNYDLITLWKSSVDRRLPDAKDSAFGVTVNDYIAFDNDGDYRDVNFDQRRVQRRFLDGFLGGLKDRKNNPVGPVFVRGTATTSRGKDYDNIIFLVADTQGGREQNANGYLFILLDDDGSPTLPGTLADNRVSAAPVSIPAKLPLEQKAVLTHELGHSFGLGDEYGESTPDDDYDNRYVGSSKVASWPFARYQKPAYFTDGDSNVQPKVDFERPSSHGPEPTEIDAYRIKWRYHRTRKASLVSSPSFANNTLTVTANDPSVRFSPGETVFLRKRRINRQVLRLKNTDSTKRADIISPTTFPKGYLLKRHTVLQVNAASNKLTIKPQSGSGSQQELELVAGQADFFKKGERVRIYRERASDPIQTIIRTPSPTDPDHDTIAILLSPALKVESVTNAQVVLSIPTGTLQTELQILQADEEMLLYAPITADGATAQYPYAELISRPILDYLNTNPYALNANKAHKEIIDTSDIQNSSLPSSLVPCCSRRKKEIVAVYSGGARTHGDIYHPTAQCMMNTSSTGKKEKRHYIELCAVCRYTLVNMISPASFRKFDEDYMNRKIYPT